VPYVQTNFVLGLDSDEGAEPFELTKKFVDMTPGAFPGYSLLSAFGQAAPLNLEFQRAGRILPFPFHFLDNNHAMNVKPQNYSWPKFYEHVIDLGKHTFSAKAITKRLLVNRGSVPRWMNLVRAVSSEGYGRISYNSAVLRLLESDRKFRDYFERETTDLPDFYTNQVVKDLGPLYDWLPAGALHHDPNAYLKSTEPHVAESKAPLPVEVMNLRNGSVIEVPVNGRH
jgi:hypothetical protein